MTDTITYKGRTYQVGGDDHKEPLLLPDFLPTVLPAGWSEIAAPWKGVERDYARAYRKHDTVSVIVTCAQQLDGKRWLHVSVARRNREAPQWALMAEVKDLFIGPERTALQVMPPRSKHVNIHEGCLHWWHCLDGDVTPDFTAGGETI